MEYKGNKMMLNYDFSSENISLTIKAEDLKTFAQYIITQTKKELEDYVFAQNNEQHISRERASEMLDVDKVTLWRWAKRNYLVPITVGGKKRYKMSDINRILQK